MNVLVLNAGSASLKFEVITGLTNDDTMPMNIAAREQRSGAGQVPMMVKSRMSCSLLPAFTQRTNL